MLRLLLIILIVLNVLVFAAGHGWFVPAGQPGEPERLENQISPDALQLGEPPEKPAIAAPETIEPTVVASNSTADLPPSEEAPPTPPSESAGATETTPEETTEPAPPPAQEIPVVQTAAPDTMVEPPPAAEPPPAPVPPPPPPPPPRRICLAYAGLVAQTADSLERAAKDADPQARISRSTDGPPVNWWVHIPPAASSTVAEERAKQLRAQGVTDLFIVREAGPNQFAISLGIFKTQASAKQHQLNLQRQQINGTIISPRNPVTYKMEIRGLADRLTPLVSRTQQNLPASSGRCTP